QADGQANTSKHRGKRPAPAAGHAKVTRLAGISIPATGGRGARPAAGGTTGSTTPQQQGQNPSGGSHAGSTQAGAGDAGRPTSGTGSSPVTVSAPGGTATVKVPGGSASVSLPGASATVSVPNGSATVSVPGASASASVPNGSASVSLPGASATVSVPNGTTVSVGGQPTLHLPGLGSVLGPLGGSGSHTH
ncbi:MAG: hypothetical protein ACXVEW_08725, partial [Solirubrobacteraceae bacterium]